MAKAVGAPAIFQRVVAEVTEKIEKRQSSS